MKCDDGVQCVSKSYFCDGYVNCHDGSDEGGNKCDQKVIYVLQYKLESSRIQNPASTNWNSNFYQDKSEYQDLYQDPVEIKKN